jgi:hypothetical protein
MGFPVKEDGNLATSRRPPEKIVDETGGFIIETP